MRTQTLFVALGLVTVVSAAGAQGGTAPPASAAPSAMGAGDDRLVDRIVAVVGTEPITLSQLYTAVNERRAQGLQLPSDSAGQAAIARQVLGELVDEEVLVQKAREAKVEVTDEEVNATVD